MILASCGGEGDPPKYYPECRDHDFGWVPIENETGGHISISADGIIVATVADGYGVDVKLAQATWAMTANQFDTSSNTAGGQIQVWSAEVRQCMETPQTCCS